MATKQTFPTPDMTHLCAIDFQKVYEPSGKRITCCCTVVVIVNCFCFFPEDTFLLLDALEDNIGEFKAIKPSLILEVG